MAVSFKRRGGAAWKPCLRELTHSFAFFPHIGPPRGFPDVFAIGAGA